jgi:hypothetical protein
MLYSFAGPTHRAQPQVTPQAAPAATASSNIAPGIQYKTYRQWKVEQQHLAHDLTVADYFAGYLTKQKNQADAIKQVSRQLSADEVAELMTVYANSAFGTQPQYLPTQADNSAK